MQKRGKRYQEAARLFERVSIYPPQEAVSLMKQGAKAKFDETVEISINLGIDPKKSDQTVRGTVVLPHGTGKTPRVAVFAKGDKAKEAEEAGADEVGAEDLVQKIKGGWSGFDLIVASPDMMGLVGKELGRVLGPRMPNPKAGTVSPDLGKTVREIKSGKVQYRADKLGIVHTPIGKVSYEDEKLLKNLGVLVDAVVRAKPPTAKGTYLKSIVISSTMGPGIKMDPLRVTALGAETK
ncbi:MAG: 50S ribosomal protein L1 [Armatimonadetes bacterium]|nr:50S ribosomal protein L1 [Armatimonadota bacterium]